MKIAWKTKIALSLEMVGLSYESSLHYSEESFRGKIFSFSLVNEGKNLFFFEYAVAKTVSVI